MAYVYRHIRLDKNQPFYIGIGSDEKFYRAFDKSRRNRYWKNIVSKCEYEIEIFMDGLTWEQACEKEKELIALYGRKDLGNGTLVNLTEGGEGASGISEKARKMRSQKMKGKKNASGTIWSDEKRKKLSEKMKVLYWERLYDAEYENAKRLGFAE